MTIEVALWIIGAATVPLVGWFIWLTLIIAQLKSDVSRLLGMDFTKELSSVLERHTREMNDVIDRNTSAIHTLTHYVTWLSEREGVHPPPPLGLQRTRGGGLSPPKEE